MVNTLTRLKVKVLTLFKKYQFFYYLLLFFNQCISKSSKWALRAHLAEWWARSTHNESPREYITYYYLYAVKVKNKIKKRCIRHNARRIIIINTRREKVMILKKIKREKSKELWKIIMIMKKVRVNGSDVNFFEFLNVILKQSSKGRGCYC